MGKPKLEAILQRLEGSLNPDTLHALEGLRKCAPELEQLAQIFGEKEEEVLELFRRIFRANEARFEDIILKYEVPFDLKNLEMAIKEKRSYPDATYSSRTGGAVAIYRGIAPDYRLEVHLRTKNRKPKVLLRPFLVDPLSTRPFSLDYFRGKFKLVVEDKKGKKKYYSINTATHVLYVDRAKLGEGPYTARIEKI